MQTHTGFSSSVGWASNQPLMEKNRKVDSCWGKMPSEFSRIETEIQ